ncbi:hypothetical protein QE152_g2038 [Popillia japonica]|uniref:Integrase catalytic domain-containing protein n=1 Tax=Popillia japonica TaxID=7064 RepID=A0AAW1N762_POPJA
MEERPRKLSYVDKNKLQLTWTTELRKKLLEKVLHFIVALLYLFLKKALKILRLCFDFRELNKTTIRDHYPIPLIDQLELLKLCFDFRELNKTTIRDHYPIPLIDQLELLKDKKYFTSLDLNNGFYHVRVAESSLNFSKFVKLYAVKFTKTDKVIKKLEEYFNNYSRPRRIVSDRETSFTSQAFEDFLKANSIMHMKIATASNGQIERINRDLTPMLAKLAELKDKWDGCLYKVEFAINNTICRSTGKTPSMLLFGINQRVTIYAVSWKPPMSRTPTWKFYEPRLKGRTCKFKRTINSTITNPTRHRAFIRKEILLWSRMSIRHRVLTRSFYLNIEALK